MTDFLAVACEALKKHTCLANPGTESWISSNAMDHYE